MMDASVQLPINSEENNRMNVIFDNNLICRLCLSTKAKFNLFKSGFMLVNKIETCCAIEIQQDDGLPEHICTNCIDTLEIASNFRAQCRENDKILRNKANNIEMLEKVDVKLEICYDDNLVDSDNTYIKEEIDVKDENHLNLRIKKSKSKKKKKRNEEKKKEKQAKDSAECMKVVVKTIGSKTHHKSNLCTICGKYFEKRSAYYAHARTHRMDSFPCTECSKVFNRKAKLKDHLITHYGVKNIPCDECGKLFASKAYVQKHIDKVHKKLRTVACPICMKKLADNRTLKCHMKTHTGEKEYSCDVCMKQFTYKFSLQYHMRTHSGEKPYSCRYCFKKFSDSKSSSDHQLLHTGETPYRCPVCSKGFAQLSNMKSHFRYNHKGKDLKDYPSYKKRDNKSDNCKPLAM